MEFRWKLGRKWREKCCNYINITGKNIKRQIRGATLQGTSPQFNRYLIQC